MRRRHNELNPLTCDPDRIELFLEQKLGDAELSAFESHLSGCDDCRRRLETAVASEDIWSEMRASLQNEQLPPDSPRSGDSESTGEDASSSQTTVLNLLGPTDDDRMLGRWGTYEVVGVVGSGGMGVVLKALDAALNRYVAIKILAPHLGSSGGGDKTLLPRGQGRRRGGPRQRDRNLRRGRSGRAAVSGHALCPRAVVAAAAGRRRAAGSCRNPPRRHAGRRRAGRRPCPRARPSRREAGQHPAWPTASSA